MLVGEPLGTGTGVLVSMGTGVLVITGTGVLVTTGTGVFVGGVVVVGDGITVDVLVGEGVKQVGLPAKEWRRGITG